MKIARLPPSYTTRSLSPEGQPGGGRADTPFRVAATQAADDQARYRQHWQDIEQEASKRLTGQPAIRHRVKVLIAALERLGPRVSRLIRPDFMAPRHSPIDDQA